MAPGLIPGDLILVDRWAYRETAPARGEVIVFRYPDDRRVLYVQRIIGAPEDEVRIEGDAVWINGFSLERETLGLYLLQTDTDKRTFEPRAQVH